MQQPFSVTDIENVHPLPTDIAVVVGRFQTPALHDGHSGLLRALMSKYRRMVVLIGCTERPSRRDPIDYASRENMLRRETRRIELELHQLSETVPVATVTFAPIVDCPDGKTWSERLDRTLYGMYPRERFHLWCGRQGFLTVQDGYVGRHHDRFVWSPPATSIAGAIAAESGTRKRLIAEGCVVDAERFRAGMIYQQARQVPAPVMCVDVALIHGPTRQIALGQKDPDGDQWRFPGGHVEAQMTLERTAQCEVSEELGYDLDEGRLTYLGSYHINDHRGTPENPYLTALFLYDTGVRFPQDPPPIRAGDDLDRVRWHRMKGIASEHIVPTHRALFDRVAEWTAQYHSEPRKSK